MSVAQSYAKALYETAAEKKASSEEFDQIENQMDQLLTLFNHSKETRVALFGPVTTAREKVAVVESIAKKMGMSPILTQFLALLARKGRLSLFHTVRDAFTNVRLSYEGGVAGQLVSADALSDSDINSLAKAFSHKLGKKVAFRVSTDPLLLAGMKVTVNGVTYDGTLRSQLHKLRDRFVTGYAGNA